MPSRGWPDDTLLGTTVLGRLRLVRRLGSGGMGTVYRAQSRDGRLYAVKTLHPWLSQSDDMNRRFRREARAAARLEGPHTVRVQDSGELPDGTLFIVMELVDGESLTDRVEREGWLDAPTTLRILRQLALGLAEAHALGLVHRDLKPDNIYLTPGPAGDHVKILDFGIVKYLDAALGTIGQTDTGRVFGTPEYMSPEQARGDPDLDHRSDIFSAGILAFVCLTGRLPWEGADPRAAMVRRLTEDAPRVTAVRRDLEVPAALVDLVARMLARVPADRPADMAEVVRAIDALERDQDNQGPTRASPHRSASPEPPGSETRRVTRGLAKGLWSTGLLFFAAMAGVAFALARCTDLKGH
jgi:serine/threonine protein kinase